jgi:hypothetical protein
VVPGEYKVLAAVNNSKVGSVYEYNPTKDTGGIAFLNTGDELWLLQREPEGHRRPVPGHLGQQRQPGSRLVAQEHLPR